MRFNVNYSRIYIRFDKEVYEYLIAKRPFTSPHKHLHLIGFPEEEAKLLMVIRIREISMFNNHKADAEPYLMNVMLEEEYDRVYPIFNADTFYMLDLIKHEPTRSEVLKSIYQEHLNAKEKP